MRRVGVLVLLLLHTVAHPVRAQSCAPARTALVLSGGGAKGLAHIGVLRVLDSLGVLPDLVVGTSIGAILGAMYASGYTGRQIDSLTRSLELTGLFRTYEPRAPRSLGFLQPLIVWEQGERGFHLQRAAVREPEVNALLNAALLRGNLLARGNFDSLPIPFRAVATDLTRRQTVVLATGDLARAVRASLAIPLVFEPERMDGRYLGDGALVANIPVRVARAEGAKRVIVSDATEHPGDSLNLDSPIALADHLLGFLFNQGDDSLGAGDVTVRPEVDGFASLDFSPTNIAELIARGYAAARTALGEATCLPQGPKPRTPGVVVRFGALAITGGRSSDQRFLQRYLRLDSRDTVDLPQLRSAIRKLGESDRYKAFWLTPSGPADSLRIDARLRPASRRLASLGLTYDNDIGGRMWVGAVDRTLLRQGVEANALILLGEFRQELNLGWRTLPAGPGPLVPTFTIGLGRESVRRFDSTGAQLRGVRVREAIGFLGVERGFPLDWQAAAGGESRLWHDPGAGDRGALGVVLRLSKGRPSAEPPVQAEAAWTTAYTRLHLDAGFETGIGRLRLSPGLRYGWGKDLPLQTSFMLGGGEGFPGRHIGEHRGDREALVRLNARYPLVGPLEARAQVVAGRTATGGPMIPRGRWRAGARLGVGAETPIGPIRVEYGRSGGGRDAMFVRIGRWF